MNSFSEAIQPILKFLQICGLDFLQDEGSNRTRYYFHRSYAAVCLLLNVSWNSYVYVKSPPTLTKSTINDFIDFLNIVFCNVGSHMAMYFMTFGSFREICFTIQRLERHFEHDAQYFRKLRHSSWIAVSYIVSFVMVQVLLTLYYHRKLNGLPLLKEILANFDLFYPMASYCLFFISALAFAANFQHVNSMLAHYLQRGSKVANSLDLAEIRTNHALVCQSVDQLNSLFQTLSLIHVVFAFTGLVNTSFMIIDNKYFLAKVILFQLECIARLGLLGYVCDHTQFQALACLKTLSCITSDNITSHSLLHQKQQVLLGGQILQTAPTFDVYGMFHISRQLLPQLIGTTITYLVILYQFKGTS